MENEGQALTDDEIKTLAIATSNSLEKLTAADAGVIFYDMEIPVDCSFSQLRMLVQMLINNLLPVCEGDAIANHPIFSKWLKERE